MTLTGEQVREARNLLGWPRTGLATAAGVSQSVYTFERGTIQPSDWVRVVLRAALKPAGVEFIAENGGGVGVRLRKKP